MDLIIARLPALKERERIALCESLEGESDLLLRSRRDIEALLGRRLGAGWDLGPARLMAERDERGARARGIGWVSWHSAAYPPLLREIYDPPAVLFFRGSLPDPERPLAGIVGTRRPSPAAAAQAFDVARGLALGGVSVASGLALGVDSMAHRGCIEGGAPTYAVMGSGLDGIYPASNRALARRALETGGGLLSEYQPGVGPRKWRFPARNRIVAGLCRGVLVAEAPEKSGALITARLANDHGREVWVASAGAAPDGAAGAPGGEGARFDRRGTQRLAEDGAEVVYSASDILGMWGIEAPGAEPCRDTAGAGREAAAAAASSLACSLGITL